MINEVIRDTPTIANTNQESVSHDKGGTDKKPMTKERLKIREEPERQEKWWACTKHPSLQPKELKTGKG